MWIVNIESALDIAARYGQTDGVHHKQWVIDQMVRALLGDDEKYAEWVRDQKDGEHGPDTYEYDTSIAP